MDACGFGAGDVALSLNNEGRLIDSLPSRRFLRLAHYLDGYRLIRDAGIRSEFLLRILDKKDAQPDSLIIKTSDNTVAGSSSTFLQSKLRYVKDENGQEICLATSDEGVEVGVMMGWEKPISEATLARNLVSCLNNQNIASGSHCSKISARISR